MIISHKHKYLFIELPHTGSTAISYILRKHHDGTPILKKHSTYFDFLRIAKPQEKSYFVFSGIRNPLDEAVSNYFKAKTDHGEWYTNPTILKKRTSLGERNENRMFHYIRKTNADFDRFFLKFYRIPYNNWNSISRKYYDFVIRFEKIQEDFNKAIELIGIDPVGSLNTRNPTADRKKDFASYYCSPAVIHRARRVFGPFMKEWGYEFPAEWGEITVSRWDQLEFELVDVFRRFYWRYLRIRT